MSETVDLLLEHRRLRRRLTLWRVLALLLLVLALFGLARMGRPSALSGGPHLVRLRVGGVIGENRDRLQAIDRALDDKSVKGMILAIDSPGGSVSGGEALHDAIARFAASKPVVVTMGGLAASAGYMIAVPAARIYASNATLTGSIGVILQSPDLSRLLDRLGVGIDELVSGPLKGQPSVAKPLSPEGRAMLQGVVADLFEQFVSMVAKGRHMAPDKVRALADGRPYTGHQALGLGLVDAIGGEREARKWLESSRGIPASMPIRPLRIDTGRSRFRLDMNGLARDLAQALVDAAFRAAFVTNRTETPVKILSSQGVVLDGGVALWQP